MTDENTKYQNLLYNVVKREFDRKEDFEPHWPTDISINLGVPVEDVASALEKLVSEEYVAKIKASFYQIGSRGISYEQIREHDRYRYVKIVPKDPRDVGKPSMTRSEVDNLIKKMWDEDIARAKKDKTWRIIKPIPAEPTEEYRKWSEGGLKQIYRIVEEE